VNIDPPTVNAPSPRTSLTVNIDECYETANGRRSDHAAMIAALAACRERGAARLVLPRRTYHFDNPSIDDRGAHILVEDMHDLTIDGSGSELMFHHVANAFRFVRCKRMVLRDVVIDWAFRLTSPGHVVKRPDGRTAVWFPPHYPVDESTLITAVSEYDIERYRWAMNGVEIYYPKDVELIGPQTMYSPSFEEERRPPHGQGGLAAGMQLVVRHYVYQATCVDFGGAGNEDLAFEDITIYQCPGHAFCGYNAERGFRLSRVKIERRAESGTLVSATADGAHFGAVLGDIVIEDCDFSMQGDDSVNIHGTWLEVTSQADARTLVMTGRWLSDRTRLEPGEELKLCRKADLEEYSRAEIVGSVFDAATRTVRVEVAADLPGGVAEGDYVANVTRSSSRFHIRGNYFHDHRARGMLLQARHGLVEDNHIRNVMGAALQMTADCNYWKEGLVRDNLIERTNNASWERCPTGRHMAAVSLVVDTPTGLGTYPVHCDITFERNVVRETPGLAFLVASARDVTVSGNVIVDANTEPFDGTGSAIDAAADGSVMVTRAANVRVLRNRRAATRPTHATGIHVDGRNTSDVVVEGNEGF